MSFIQKGQEDTYPCPFSRTFSEPVKSCIGSRCPVWRDRPVQADHPAVVAAVKSLAHSCQSHKVAVAEAWKRRDEFGIPKEPFEGYCGAGGMVVLK